MNRKSRGNGTGSAYLHGNTWVGQIIGLVAIPAKYMSVIFGVPILYCIVALVAKRIYIKKFGEWI